MNYKALFQGTKSATTPIKVGLIGTGAFGKSFLFQARAVGQLEIPVVCDRELAVARQTCLAAGMTEAQLVSCHTADEARAAMERRVKDATDYGTTHLFVLEVLCYRLQPGLLEGKAVPLERLDPVARLGGHYATLGPQQTLPRPKVD